MSLVFNPRLKIDRDSLRAVLDKDTLPTDEEFVRVQASTRPDTLNDHLPPERKKREREKLWKER